MTDPVTIAFTRILVGTVAIASLAGVLAGSALAVWRARRWPHPPVIIFAVALCLMSLAVAACVVLYQGG